jgi:hypothetical protein
MLAAILVADWPAPTRKGQHLGPLALRRGVRSTNRPASGKLG